MLKDITTTLLRPQASVASTDGPSLWSGTIACVLAGVLYSVLCASLASQGLSPTSDRGLLVQGEHFFGIAQYYGPVAFLGPACMVTWVVWLFGRTSSKRPTYGSCWARLSLAYGAPFLFCFALPDLIFFHLRGFEGLRLGLPAVGFATVYFVTSRTTLAIRQLLGMGGLKSFGVALVAACLQAPILMMLVR